MEMRKKQFNRWTILFLSLMLVLSSFCTVFAAAVSADNAMEQTADYVAQIVAKPELGSIGGEWAVLGLARSNSAVPEQYYNDYYKGIVETVTACKGELSENKYTEYSRVILALTAIGKDVTDVGGYNLLEKLADYNKVLKQGINGPIFALIALDTHNYVIPQVKDVEVQTTRQLLIDYVLSKEITDSKGVTGGFSLSGNVPDPDVTGMALQALAKYQDQPKVKQATDRALTVLSVMQNSNGGYSSWGTENAESVVQVLVALCELGIRPDTDSRFIKNGNTLLNSLLSFYQTGGGFEHVYKSGINQMATEQCLYGLTAYNRCISGAKSLYDMTDVTLDTQTSPSVGTESPANNEIKIKVNDQYITFNQAPILESGTTLVPMRAIFESLGASMKWDQSAQKVTGTLGEAKVELVIGQKEASVNGKNITLEVAARLENGTTLVPVRFVSESLGASVAWDNAARTVIINR
ncbi:stalk domain-containing protein [Clostridium aminobutyricum]|uniref:stalk domain-containing protein n=1 Tax=Clostridium aminobutyricum TaxID=33953 RepID=UPI001FD6A358|nr:stalk domain-containing protein [Clostridium aminobutyricum]